MAANSPAVVSGFVDLLTAHRSPVGSFVNIIGVIVDVMPPLRTRTGQWTFTFKLQDVKFRDSLGGEQGMTVRYFRDKEADLPQVKDHGDVILLKRVRVHEHNSQKIAISHFSTTELVFPSAKLPTPGYAMAYMGGMSKLPCLGSSNLVSTLSAEEQAYIIDLKAAFPEVKPQNSNADTTSTNTGPRNIPTSSNGRPSRKFKVIRELQHRDFADLKVEVVKKFSLPDGNCELYVTDYSANKRMFYYKPPEDELEPGQDGDVFGYGAPAKKQWPGPYGWLVLKVNVKQPHAAFANQYVNEGNLVHLQNLKGKVMNDQSKLEGDMWHDSINPGKVQISFIRDTRAPEISDMLGRKHKYWAERKAKGLLCPSTNTEPVVAPAFPPPPKTNVLGETAAQETADAVAPKAKKSEKKKRQKLKALESKTTKEKKEIIAREKASGVNMHVRCGYNDQAPSSFEDILDLENHRHTNIGPSGQSYKLPFINANYRTTARVIDFSPDELEDFALFAEPDPEEKSEFSQHAGWESNPKWEWDFSLHLEEAGTGRTIWVNVGHSEAQHLFGNTIEDPSDLHSNSKLVNKLREKLCILWGNLEEKKRGKKRRTASSVEEQPSNKPFHLCLSEYGVLVEGGDESSLAAHERQYMMHSVAIM